MLSGCLSIDYWARIIVCQLNFIFNWVMLGAMDIKIETIMLERRGIQTSKVRFNAKMRTRKFYRIRPETIFLNGAQSLTQIIKIQMDQNLCLNDCCLENLRPQDLKDIEKWCKCPKCLKYLSRNQMEEQQGNPYSSYCPQQFSSQAKTPKTKPFNIFRDYRETSIGQSYIQHADHAASSDIILRNWKKSKKNAKSKQNTKNIRKGHTKQIRKPRNKSGREDDKNSCRSVNRCLLEITKKYFQKSCCSIIHFNKHNNLKLLNKAILIVHIEKRLNSAEKFRLQKMLKSEAQNLRNQDADLFSKTIEKLEAMIGILQEDCKDQDKLRVLEDAGNDRSAYGRYKVQVIEDFEAELQKFE